MAISVEYGWLGILRLTCSMRSRLSKECFLFCLASHLVWLSRTAPFCPVGARLSPAFGITCPAVSNP
jgi:hypothetical protein